MRHRFRPIHLLALAALSASALADQTFVKLNAYPTIAVADGHSFVNVTAEIRDGSGHRVPDGTSVMFTTTLGSFRQNVVNTVDGVAQAVLVAGGVPGTAKITASPINASGSPTVLSYEFVGSRADLDTAKEYVEVVAPTHLLFSNDARVIEAAGKDHGVSLRYHEIEIHADDLQYDINSYTVRAKKAKLRMGRVTREFDQLNLVLNTRKGFGTTTIQTYRPSMIAPLDQGVVFLDQLPDGSYGPAKLVDRLGSVEIARSGIHPANALTDSALYEFQDLSDAMSSIQAKKAVVFPRKEIQFQRADMYVGTARVMRMPLFAFSLISESDALVTNGLLNVYDNQIQFNYPQYLALRPGLTSLLRFRIGDQTGRSIGASGGAFLDYELSWNHGDDFDGGLTIGGLGRNDWSLGLRQYWKMDSRTTALAQVSMPANRSLVGNASLSRAFNGYSAGLTASHSQTVRGLRQNSQDLAAYLEANPVRLSNTPVRFSYGLVASQSQSYIQQRVTQKVTQVNNDGTTTTKDKTIYYPYRAETAGAGLTARLQSDAIKVDGMSTLTASLSASRLYGPNAFQGIGLIGNVSYSRRLGRSAHMLLGYDYTQGGLNRLILGQHRLTLQGNTTQGRTTLNVTTVRSLDVNQTNVFADLNYRFKGPWSLASTYTWQSNPIYSGNQFLDQNTFLDYSIVLGYQIGMRQVGLTWSYQTHRIGVQLLGASF